MAKTADQIARALKLKAQPKNNSLTFRVGVKKYTLPFEARALMSDKYLFLHIPSDAALFKFENGDIVPVSTDEEAKAAQASFRTTRKKREGKSKAPVEMPAELQAALAKIPAGYRLAMDNKGQVRLVKTRNRTKKS